MTSSVFGLPVSHVSEWIFNSYVISGDTSLIVVDPGLPVLAKRVLRLVGDDLEADASEIKTVLCTHAHPDHVAGVSTIEQAAGAGTYLPARCQHYLDGETPRTFPLMESTMRFLSVYREQPFSLAATKEFVSLGRTMGIGGPPAMHLDFDPAGFLADGDPIAGASGWQVIHAPGHTDDSTCFYHADSATLISGDAVVTQDGRAWFNPENVDLGVASVTEERLRALEVRHLLPGHGMPIEASDVWATARSAMTKPTGTSLLARCSRRFGRWEHPVE